MKRKAAILIGMCACLMCIPSSAKESAQIQPPREIQRFSMTIPDEWVQRDERFLLTAPSGYEDHGFDIVPAPKGEK